MRVRKTHSKSRTGCLSCKKKHIKCGEELPACHNCSLRDVVCMYGQVRPMTVGDPTGGSRSPEHRSSNTVREDNASELPSSSQVVEKNSLYSTSPSFTRLDELQLLLHYVNATSETISQDPEDLYVWQRAVPDEAVQHEFLMDGLLALSSLHFAFEHPCRRARYVEIAMHYHNSGLRRYTDAICNITENNSPAVFAFSILIYVTAFASSTIGQCSVEFSYTESIASFFELLHGVNAINEVAENVLQQSCFKALWRPSPLEQDPPKLETRAGLAISKLRQRAKNISKYLEPERSEVYFSSIDNIESILRLANTSFYVRGIMAFPATTDKRLLEYFRRGDPLAILIFLHYGVLLSDLRDYWWAGGDYGLRLVEELITSVCSIDTEWEEWTEWARITATNATGGVVFAHCSTDLIADEL